MNTEQKASALQEYVNGFLQDNNLSSQELLKVLEIEKTECEFDSSYFRARFLVLLCELNIDTPPCLEANDDRETGYFLSQLERENTGIKKFIAEKEEEELKALLDEESLEEEEQGSSETQEVIMKDNLPPSEAVSDKNEDSKKPPPTKRHQFVRRASGTYNILEDPKIQEKRERHLSHFLFQQAETGLTKTSLMRVLDGKRNWLLAFEKGQNAGVYFLSRFYILLELMGLDNRLYAPLSDEEQEIYKADRENIPESMKAFVKDGSIPDAKKKRNSSGSEDLDEDDEETEDNEPEVVQEEEQPKKTNGGKTSKPAKAERTRSLEIMPTLMREMANLISGIPSGRFYFSETDSVLEKDKQALISQIRMIRAFVAQWLPHNHSDVDEELATELFALYQECSSWYTANQTGILNKVLKE